MSGIGCFCYGEHKSGHIECNLCVYSVECCEETEKIKELSLIKKFIERCT